MILTKVKALNTFFTFFLFCLGIFKQFLFQIQSNNAILNEVTELNGPIALFDFANGKTNS